MTPEQRRPIGWTEGHERLFQKLEAVDPITAAGRRAAARRKQKELGQWLADVADEQAEDRRRGDIKRPDPWGWGASGLFETGKHR